MLLLSPVSSDDPVVSTPTPVPSAHFCSPTVSDLTLADLSTPGVSSPVPVTDDLRLPPSLGSSPALNEFVLVPRHPPVVHPSLAKRSLPRVTRKPVKLDSVTSSPLCKSTTP